VGIDHAHVVARRDANSQNSPPESHALAHAKAYSMLLDVVLLRTFVAVVEANGFTRAAGFVNLTQSAVSLHIKRLEEQIGRRLFDRAAPKIVLTSDGEILLSYAQRILALEEEVKARLGHPQPQGRVRFGAPEYFDPGTLASLLAQFNSRYPAINLEIQMGTGPDIAALYGRGLLDVAIINREIDEADGAARNGNGPSEDTTVLYREGRVWAALRGMKLERDRPVPLALFPTPCAWRQLAQERLQSVGRRWTVALQSTGLSGIVTAVEAGLAISIFAQSGLSPRLRALGPAQGLPALPDFEYVLRRNAKRSLAADRLRDVIIDYFRLAAALRGTDDDTNTQTTARGRVTSG
jgi:DNA-binding transcriptional LysR family regulator